MLRLRLAISRALVLAVPVLGDSVAAGAKPCAAEPTAAVSDKVAAATFKAYRGWKKVNDKPVLSETHGNRWVFTYLNKPAEGAGLAGKFPFPPGAVLVKEFFKNQGGKLRDRGPLFVMENAGGGTRPPTTTGTTRW